MPRVTVYVDDELYTRMRAEHPELNKSAVFQAGLRSLESCEHLELRCRCCGDTVTRAELAGAAMAGLYRAINARLFERVAQPGYEGAARLIRNLAADHGVPGVLATPVPRKTRAQRAALEDPPPASVTELPTEAGSRSNHPTARRTA